MNETSTPPVIPAVPNVPRCIHCQSLMFRGTKKETSLALQVLGVFVFLAGLAISFTIIGALLGVPLMIAACFLGYKKRRGWKCRNCGYFFDAR